MSADACGWVDMMVSVWGKLSSKSFDFLSGVESVAIKIGEKVWEFEERVKQMK